MTRLTIQTLHDKLGIKPDTPGYGRVFGPLSKKLLRAKLTNLRAPALTSDDFIRVAADLVVPVGHIRGVRKVEAPKGPFDDSGMPTHLYERHVFSQHSGGRFDKSHPHLSAKVGYGKGGYGPQSGQFDRFAAACALDPEAAFRACSWGAFQVLGENWEGCKYPSVYDMVTGLVVSEAAHLDSFARFVRMKGLEDELRACRPGDPDSCIPFVERYNGKGFRVFGYHKSFAAAI